MNILLIFFCIILEAGYQLCFKSASYEAVFLKVIRKPILWLGVAFWGVEIAVWMRILQTAPLSVAFPLMSLSYVAVLASGAFMFKEHVSKRHALGALLITIGAACIGLTEI